ncbi:MAG: hypothetical protein JWO90_123, partial [Solirubrobacterales bacterium]|nr:hypothetical protein [Solirubrobacterales bacterium]
MRTHRLLLALAALLTAAAPAAHAQVTVPAGFDQVVLAAGLSQPTQVAFAPDDSFFVAEKPGRIRMVGPDGTLRRQPVLDIASRVNDVQDRGLIGLAVDPAWATTRRLFYAYTYERNPLNPDQGGPTTARVESVVVGSDGRASAPIVILGRDGEQPCPRAADDCLPSDGRSHSVGAVVPDPRDGTLWLALGDSASYNQVDDLAFRAQEEGSLAGKLLHVDPQGRGLPGHPFCRAEADLTKACTKLHAKGFRNPFRFHLRDGVPIVGDVGWGSREELDRGTAGGNFGWPCLEGDLRTPGYDADARCQALYAAGGTTGPLHAYSHEGRDAAIVGGPAAPAGGAYGSAYAGQQFFGDYAQAKVRRLVLGANGACTTTPCTVLPFAEGWVGGTDLQLDRDGNLVWTLFGDGGPTGSVVAVRRTNGNRTPVAVASSEILPGSSGRGYRFSSAGSRDPDGDALQVRWDFGDGSTGTGASAEHVYAPGTGPVTVVLGVDDGRGGSARAELRLRPGDAPPVPVLAAPADGAAYVAGEPVELRGSATDEEEGALTGRALTWRIVLRHGTHAHALTDAEGGATSFTPYDDHDADSHYEVTLVATDGAGNRVESRTVEVHPRTVALGLRSLPSGAPMGYADQSSPTPADRRAGVGFRTTLSAADTFASGGLLFRFRGWADGGSTLQRALRVPGADTTLTAVYGEDKAAGRPTLASSTAGATRTPDKAVDGSAATRWSSALGEDGQTWQVDLGAPRAVDAVVVDWETAFAARYALETSLDGEAWQLAAEVEQPAPGRRLTSFAPRSARWVRLRGITRATAFGISFWELGVLGPPDPAGPGHAPAPAPVPGLPPTSSGGGSDATPTGFRAVLRSDRTRRASFRARGLRFALTCSAACTARVALRVDATTARALRRSSRTLRTTTV